MTGPGAEMDVQTALSTIDRAIAYTQPLRRRIEGLTWVLFGLISCLFAFSYWWILSQSLDPTYWLLAAWLVAYALLSVTSALLAWRVASAIDPEYSIDARRAGLVFGVIAVLLVGLDLGLWAVLGDAQVTVALAIVTFGGAAWAGQALAQWSRLSRAGRRDTWGIGVAMALLGFVLVYGLRADATTVPLDILVLAATTGGVPLLAGLWRVARG